MYTADLRIRKAGDSSSEDIVETDIELDDGGLAKRLLDREPGYWQVSSRLRDDNDNTGDWEPWRMVYVPTLLKSSDGFLIGISD